MSRKRTRTTALCADKQPTPLFGQLRQVDGQFQGRRERVVRLLRKQGAQIASGPGTTALMPLMLYTATGAMQSQAYGWRHQTSEIKVLSFSYPFDPVL